VTLQHGAASVCSISGQCVELTQPGDTAVITSVNGKVTIQKTNSGFNFAANCSAAAGLCTVTDYAAADPAVTPPVEDDPTGMLCGR
jgi:hypothetical protein